MTDLDLGIRELDGNAEAVAEPAAAPSFRPPARIVPTGQRRRGSIRLLEPGLDGLRQLCNRCRTVLRLVDVLLDLVEHEYRQRHFAIGRQRLFGGGDELVGRDVGLRRWELVEQELPGRLDVRSEGRIRGDECLRDDWAHIEVVEFPIPTPTCGLDGPPYPFQQPIVP